MAPVDVENNKPGPKYKWSCMTRAIACFDLITNLLFVFIIIDKLIESYNGDRLQGIPAVGGISSVYRSIVFFVVNIFLSYFLLTASYFDIHPGVALRRANTWIILNSIFFIVLIFINHNSIGEIIFIVVVRGSFIAIVWKFIGELQIAVAEES